jgi:hypothetical protein
MILSWNVAAARVWVFPKSVFPFHNNCPSTGFPVISSPRILPTVPSWIFTKQFGFPEQVFLFILITALFLFWLYRFDLPRVVFLFYSNDDRFGFFAATVFHACNNNTNIPSYFSAIMSFCVWTLLLSLFVSEIHRQVAQLYGRGHTILTSRDLMWYYACNWDVRGDLTLYSMAQIHTSVTLLASRDLTWSSRRLSCQHTSHISVVSHILCGGTNVSSALEHSTRYYVVSYFFPWRDSPLVGLGLLLINEDFCGF